MRYILFVLHNTTLDFSRLTNLLFLQKVAPISSKNVKLPRADRICDQLCGGETSMCDHPCRARCHPGPHPPCTHPVPFTCDSCKFSTSYPCGWPRELLICEKCHLDIVPAGENSEQKKKHKQLPTKQGEKEVKRGDKKHIQIVRQVTSFFNPAFEIESQIEVVRCQKLINPSLSDRW